MRIWSMVLLAGVMAVVGSGCEQSSSYGESGSSSGIVPRPQMLSIQWDKRDAGRNWMNHHGLSAYYQVEFESPLTDQQAEMHYPAMIELAKRCCYVQSAESVRVKHYLHMEGPNNVLYHVEFTDEIPHSKTGIVHKTPSWVKFEDGDVYPYEKR